ncbi:MAG: DNA mismatch repair protein MutS [Clostridioides sp.]|nr:DNA mismatch repair protein MutS [Clostridioides sp.]
MKVDKTKVTPMMRQYLDVKDKYPDSLLFFRLGDFYEMFFEDALVASKVLEIALTGKSCGLDERAPMCGVPYHAADAYISRLVENGYKVAIGEQLEDPATAKGIVKRDVIRVITPGTVLDGNLLDNKKNNYLLSIYKEGKEVGLSFVDISTGETSATFIDESRLIEEISKISPTEIIINDLGYIDNLKTIAAIENIYVNENFDEAYLDENIIEEYLDKSELSGVKFDSRGLIKKSLAIIFNYILSTQKQITSNINHINIYNSSEYMVLDVFTRTNLELTETIRGKKKKGSLLHVLDKTATAMGGRLLRKYVEEPLNKKEKIEARLDLIEEIERDFSLREDLNYLLKNIYDIERICGKIAFERVTPKELINLKNSVEKLPELIGLINTSTAAGLKNFCSDMENLDDIYNLVDESILEEPSLTIKDGNIIKPGFNEELDALRDISKNGASMIRDIETREKEKTGVKSLKVGFNKVFGYYIEITKSNLGLAKLDETYVRKQTLTGGERFITPELKEIEEKILNAEEKIKSLEYEIFLNIRGVVYQNIGRIQKVAKKIANIDVFVSMAIVAHENSYVRPRINDGGVFEIKNGRHPVIESIVGEENFVPNDTYLKNGENIINIITGPNMAGKSTYMRQCAIIALMAHMGSFVPAESADIPIMDRIFTRVGASDDLSQGQSTFMVEMTEVSQILEKATENSLVILDEIGRGTSTYDGISLAWSIVEYIENNVKCKTLFATHYHELTELENEFEDVKNFSVAVKEDGDDVVFLRKIVQGGADKSYGIYVAELAKLPFGVIDRARDILTGLEKNHMYNKNALSSSVMEIMLTTDIDDGNNNKLNSRDENLIANNDKLRSNNDKLENENTDLKKEVAKLKKAVKENKMSKEQAQAGSVQMSFGNLFTDELVDEIAELDILNMNPLEAMNKLYELQKKAKNR